MLLETLSNRLENATVEEGIFRLWNVLGEPGGKYHIVPLRRITASQIFVDFVEKLDSYLGDSLVTRVKTSFDSTEHK